MATKAEVEKLNYEKACLEQQIKNIQEAHQKEIQELNANHEKELNKLKEELRPVTLKEVKDLIDEAIHKLSIDADDAPWDPDNGCDPSQNVKLTYGEEELGSINV